MAEPKLELYHFPSACSRVSICALEMAELEYELKLVNLAVNEQTTPEYLKISPFGKVPLMLIDGEAMVENSAIVTFVAALRPDAGILPSARIPRMQAEAVGGMSFCGGTLHPQIRGILNPQRVSNGDHEATREKSRELLTKSYRYAEDRLAERDWWLGERSIVDVYLEWTVSVARTAKFDLDAYPRLSGLEQRLAGMPAFERMQAVEQRSRKALGL
ncbi:MAG: Glutathione S-transferase [Bradyrhizobium sp.]|nr:Glutathione S-transferase [Bradyrhizobium sp.]